MTIWLLCVVLHGGTGGHCISEWPTEAACNIEKERWTREALAWTRRSKLPPAIGVICRPPE